jgi:aspartate aminotransferase-like enzyme
MNNAYHNLYLFDIKGYDFYLEWNGKGEWRLSSPEPSLFSFYSAMEEVEEEGNLVWRFTERGTDAFNIYQAEFDEIDISEDDFIDFFSRHGFPNERNFS